VTEFKQILSKVRSRGHWTVTIRPSHFRKDRVPDISSLTPLLDKIVVQLRGWDFPHIDHREAPAIGIDSIEHSFDWEHNKGAWRFYQSGQFFYVFAIALDWRDESRWWPADQNWKPGTLLGIGDVIFQYAEILEFASRLALTEAGDESMHISVEVGPLAGRYLYMDTNRNRWPIDLHRASIDGFPFTTTIEKSRLLAEHTNIAFSAALELFKRFGWATSIDIIKDWYGKRG